MPGNLSPQEAQELNQLLMEKERREKYQKIDLAFPASGPLSRFNYPKQMEFFKAGKEFKIRAIIAGNRTGKTYCASYEDALHATGLYPDWWEGHRFTKPVTILVAGKNANTTRDILQKYLLGEYIDMGSGFLPKDRILGKPLYQPSSPEGVQAMRVQHTTNGREDGYSTIILKTYEQGRGSFEGITIDVAHLDEEPTDESIFTEILTRTATTKGILYCTFTPLNNLSKVVQSFMPAGRFPINGIYGQRYVVNITWDDESSPHFTKEDREQMAKEYPAHELNARTKGLPSLGSGAVYPFNDVDITCRPFAIPEFWPKAYGMDVGWNATAAIWFAQDPSDKVLYAYSEYYGSKAEPAVHAAAIRARGAWMKGAIDPKAGTNLATGKKMLELYLEEGLHVINGHNAVDPGILKMYQLLSTGMLKIFSNLSETLAELRLYHRDENGKIPNNQRDHILDAARYFISIKDSILDLPDDRIDRPELPPSWLGASRVTGY